MKALNSQEEHIRNLLDEETAANTQLVFPYAL